VSDVPRGIDVCFLEEHDTRVSRIGARGIGELGEVGVAAAISDVIHHAAGRRIRQLPMHIVDLVA
jgi:xanthine dehydrogenase YagR molybdenum-binding subunit